MLPTIAGVRLSEFSPLLVVIQGPVRSGEAGHGRDGAIGS
jgi:hypothetical protein